MFRYLQPGEKGDYWGTSSLLEWLTKLLKGHVVPEDATVQHIEFFLQEYYANAQKTGPYAIITFYPSSIRYLGPEGVDGTTFDAHRININYDTNRVIQSISLG
jgi:hypothetical protein